MMYIMLTVMKFIRASVILVRKVSVSIREDATEPRNNASNMI